ncbi:hypothetical protein EVAR_81472_1 [Eumeta japonica]|uniref:Uncharacterized protein n=1 Tax=Eumeta variegata TaxID=151549 RepID=A0A4C1W3G0_EUMVA|nr:hypothetical protein EVAR_81472_1 [Eumeta japonica]
MAGYRSKRVTLIKSHHNTVHANLSETIRQLLEKIEVLIAACEVGVEAVSDKTKKKHPAFSMRGELLRESFARYRFDTGVRVVLLRG